MGVKKLLKNYTVLYGSFPVVSNYCILTGVDMSSWQTSEPTDPLKTWFQKFVFFCWVQLGLESPVFSIQ